MVWEVEMYCPQCCGESEEFRYFNSKDKAQAFIEKRSNLELERFERIKKSEMPAWAYLEDEKET